MPVAEKHDADIKSEYLVLFFTPSQRKKTEERKRVKRKKKKKEKLPKKKYSTLTYRAFI